MCRALLLGYARGVATRSARDQHNYNNHNNRSPSYQGAIAVLDRFAGVEGGSHHRHCWLEERKAAEIGEDVPELGMWRDAQPGEMTTQCWATSRSQSIMLKGETAPTVPSKAPYCLLVLPCRAQMHSAGAPPKARSVQHDIEPRKCHIHGYKRTHTRWLHAPRGHP